MTPVDTSAPAATPPVLCTIATRESRLAVWQAEHVAALLRRRLGWQVDLLGMTTQGDQILDRSLSKVGGKGLFVKELELALAEGRAQLAVHSLKDVPMDLPPGFALAAVLEREDPRDAFVANAFTSLADLPAGARVGTSSLRRIVQLQARYPHLDLKPVRGNVITRLRKLDDGDFDALVLAAAGLIRLGLADRIRTTIAPEEMLPAAGQGALALEVRSDAHALLAQLRTLQHDATALCVQAERAVSRALGGSCSMPLAAFAQWTDAANQAPGVATTMQLRAVLGHPGRPGQALLQAQLQARVRSPDDAEALGRAAARHLLDHGGQAVLDALTPG